MFIVGDFDVFSISLPHRRIGFCIVSECAHAFWQYLGLKTLVFMSKVKGSDMRLKKLHRNLHPEAAQFVGISLPDILPIKSRRM
jgi:hypothetical protein